MSLTWKESIATLSIIAIMIFAALMVVGFMGSVEGHWSIATLIVFLLAGLAGVLAGNESVLRHVWSAILLYICSIGLLLITLINAVFDSEGLFVSTVIASGVLWLEFMLVNLASDDTGSTHLPAGRAT